MYQRVMLYLVGTSALIVAVGWIASQPKTDWALDILTLGLVIVGLLQFQALILSRFSTERSLRAYVGIDYDYTTHVEWSNDPHPTVEFQIKNWGQTPAFALYVQANWKTFAGRKTPWPRGELYDYPKHVGGIFTLNPNGTMKTIKTLSPRNDLSFTATRNDIDVNTNRPTTTYIYGTVFFTDAYGKKQESSFCFRKDDARNRLAVADHHNGAT